MARVVPKRAPFFSLFFPEEGGCLCLVSVALLQQAIPALGPSVRAVISLWHRKVWGGKREREKLGLVKGLPGH